MSTANTRIERIEYTGPTCNDNSIVWESAGCMDSAYSEYDPGATHSNPAACLTPVSALSYKHTLGSKAGYKLMVLGRNDMLQIPNGVGRVQIYSLKGEKIWEQPVDGVEWMRLSRSFTPGLYQVRYQR